LRGGKEFSSSLNKLHVIFVSFKNQLDIL